MLAPAPRTRSPIRPPIRSHIDAARVAVPSGVREDRTMPNRASSRSEVRPPSFRDLSVSGVLAGIVAVLVGYAGSLVIVLEAARAAGLDEQQTASWVWAISIGSGVCGAALSLITRMPILLAWSTPGAALLTASLGGFSYSDAVGAFIVASAAAAIVGWTGWFGRLLALVPEPILQALLAGVLLPFVIKAGAAFGTAPLLAGGVVLVYFVGKRFFDRWAVLAALVAGVGLAAITGAFDTSGLEGGLALTTPVLTAPTFDLAAIMSIGLPLFVVTMTSQNATGLAVLRLDGYRPDDRLLVGSVSTVSALLAPLGNHAINLAAITAAIATGPATHRDRTRRYVAGVSGGLAYIAAGLFGGTIIGLFSAIPTEVIAALAAVALLGATLAALQGAVGSAGSDPRTGIAALLTLAVTMSGLTIFETGSAFWGLLAGIGAHALLGVGRRR